ncbi:cysteine-rich CWC family protein [Photobacterium sp. MCCC 1A19761]|uniref:cysteine-rich CWC family protein n=1 Tax=Photobacterium sp. MCCC 1A19761 TaxID=3115000 RepID=UPI00307F3D9A
MKTPCVAKCKNNEGICSGCFRTMAEISTWRHMDEENQVRTINEIRGEQSTHTCQQCGKPAFCDISAGKSSCWCFEISRRDTSGLETDGTTCLCRACLSQLPLRDH